jgi:C-terminal processing protease CtpA/Prc
MQVRRAYDREDADGGFVFSDSIVLTGDGAADPARVYYLVNNATGSAADELAALVKSRGLGRLLGDNTAGEGLAGSYCAASLENSGLVFTYFPGRPLLPEGTRDAVRGVFPDEYIPQTRESFYAQRAMILDGEDTYSYEGLLRYDTLLLEALRQIEAARQRHD